jgi:hypothetical protein
LAASESTALVDERNVSLSRTISHVEVERRVVRSIGIRQALEDGRAVEPDQRTHDAFQHRTLIAELVELGVDRLPK